MGYRYQRTVRPLANLAATFDTITEAPLTNIERARSGLLLVVYNQGTTKGALAYPLLRVMIGTSAADLKAFPIEDATTTVSTVGTGLQTDVRNGIKKLTDAYTNGQSYVVPVTFGTVASFQFMEVGGGLVPGTLSAVLLVELDH